jgi:hypothetical protein
MPSVPTIARAASIAVFAAAAVLILGRNDFAVGTDVGVHYGFANEITRFGWPLPATSYLAIMAHYPPAAHVLAIGIGKLVGSTLHGLFVVAAVSFVLTYVALAELMRRPGQVGTAVSMIVFLLAVYWYRHKLLFEGAELVANFFFAQFAATGMLLACAIALCRSRLSFGRWLLVAAIVTHLLGYFYSISAIQLALTCCAFQALAFLDRPSLRSAGTVVITGLMLVAVAVIHPTLIGSVAIANNDGGISIDALHETVSFVGMILGSGLLIWLRRRSNLANIDAIISLCVGVGAVCLAQFIALRLFGDGSPYAVKKYGFLIITLNAMIYSCLIVDMARLVAPWIFDRGVTRPASIAGSIFGLAALFVTVIGQASIPVKIEQQYVNEVSTLMADPNSIDLDGKTISHNVRYDAHANYTVAVGNLHPGAAILDQHALFFPDPPPPSHSQYVLIDAASAGSYGAECIVSKSEDVVAIRATCNTPSH